MVRDLVQFLFIVVLLTIFVFCWFYGDNLPNVRQKASHKVDDEIEKLVRVNEEEKRIYYISEKSLNEKNIKHFFETIMIRFPSGFTWCIRCNDKKVFYYEIRDIGEHILVHERRMECGRICHEDSMYNKITFKKIV